MIQKTLVLVKPDGVRRGLVGEIIRRIENRGLKIIGMKMQHIDEEFARKHYTEDIAIRRSVAIREALLTYIREGPVVAMVVEGVEAIHAMRHLVGGTEPKTAAPGTIRGDYCHVSFKYADNKGISIMNLIHASGDEKDAEYEVPLWFTESELHSVDLNHDKLRQD